eukprot:m.290047 g.290047  ORF g.290047 m.290047 type:complete len:72 (+) comp16377_c0_seq26:623-838(+)
MCEMAVAVVVADTTCQKTGLSCGMKVCRSWFNTVTPMRFGSTNKSKSCNIACLHSYFVGAQFSQEHVLFEC